MVINNNNIPNTPGDTPKKSLGQDFEMWLKGREKQKNFLEKKNHLDAQSQLADLKESLGKKSYEQIGDTSQDVPLSPQRNNTSYSRESIALTDAIQTRQEGDERKSILQGIEQSIRVPLRVLRDGTVDLARTFINPKGELERTIAYLEEESSAKII